MFINDVAEVPVFATKTAYVPVPILYSILYPSMAEPPLFAGAVHDKLILVGEAEVARRLVGEVGTVATCVGIAEAVFDALLMPIEFIAKTRYV